MDVSGLNIWPSNNEPCHIASWFYDCVNCLRVFWTGCGTENVTMGAWCSVILEGLETTCQAKFGPGLFYDLLRSALAFRKAVPSRINL